MTEEWRPVLGYEGIYEVSSLGNIRGVDRYVTFKDGRKPRFIRGRVLHRTKGQHYFKVELNRAGKQTTKCIHHAVCESFHGPRPDGQVVRHLNGDYLDNRAENLAWGTRAENGVDMVLHGTSYWAARTQCGSGHEYTPENTRLVTNPRNGRQFRSCLTCERDRWTARNRERDRRMAELRPIRDCEICGSAFKVPNRRSRFCSDECKKAARRKDFKEKVA